MGTIRSCIAKHPLSGNEKSDLRDIYADEGIKGIEAKREETLAKMRKLYTSLNVAFPRPVLLATPAPVEAVEDAPREERFILRDRNGKEFGYANEQQQSAIVEIGGWLKDKTSTIREYVLEGRGGTGKTTVLQKIIEDAGLSPSQVKYTATTNKAKAVLAKATGQRASTIWTALGIVPADEQYKKEGVNDEIEDLDIDNLEGVELIIIDEASMIGENMLEKILQKIEGRGIKVLYLGDSAQLPPIRSTKEALKVVASAIFGKYANSPVFNEAEYPNRVKLLTSMRQVGKSPILELTKLFTDVLDNLSVLRGSTGILIPKDRRVTNFSPATNSGVVFTTDEEFTLNSFVQDYLIKPLSTRIITTYNEQNDNQAESVYSLNREIFNRLHGTLQADGSYKTTREYGLHEAKDVLMAYTTVKFDPGDPDGPAIWNGSEYVVSDPGEVEYIEFSVAGQKMVTAEEAASSSELIIPIQMVTLEDVDSGVKITKRIPAVTDSHFKRETYINSFGKRVPVLLDDRVSRVFSAAKKTLNPTQYREFKKKHVGLSKLGDIDMHPAYAITAWKAQGSTYRNVYVAEDALNASKGFLSAKGSYQALYVALSRPTDKLVMYSERLNSGAGSAASLAPKTEAFPTGTDHSAQNTNVQEADITEQLNSAPTGSVHPASKEELAARQEDYNSAKLPADLVAKIKAGKATTASMVKWLMDNAQNPAYQELAKSVQAKIGKFSTYNAPVKYSAKPIKQGKYEFDGMAHYTDAGGPSHIELSPGAMNEELVLHELLHLAAITNYNDGKDGSGTKAQIDAVNNLDKIASYIKGELQRNPDKYSEYDTNMLKRLQSMRHSDELLTYGLTNKHAQRLLKGIQAGKILGLRKTGSVWAQFMTTVKQLLGLKDIDNTVLEQVLGASSILLTPQEQQAELSQENFSTTAKAIKVGKKIVDATAAAVIKIATELPKIVKSHTVMAELALGNLIKANNRAGVDLEGSTIDKLIKITQSRSGIFNIPAETFNNPDALASALVSLMANKTVAFKKAGVTEATAIKIVQHYQNYNAAYQQLRINDIRESSESLKKYGVPILEQPMHLLAAIDDKGIATLPPQVVLAMSIGTSHWVSQNITDNPFGGDNKQKSQFLYGDMGHPLDPIDHENLSVLGLPHTETAAEVGMYIQKLMGMSAVSTRTQPYMEALAAAMGTTALEVLSTNNTLENNPVVQLVIDDHYWHFLNRDQDGKFIANTKAEKEVLAGNDDRSFNHGTTHKHIKFVPGGTLRARDLDQIKAENAESNEVLGILGNHNDRTNSQLMLDTPETNVFSDIRGSFGKAPSRMRSLMKTLQQVAWTTTDMIDTLGKLAESDLELVHEIIGVVQYDERYESSRRVESLKASNADKIDTLELILKAHKSGGLKKYYYTFRVMNQHRIMMRGEINAQNSHITRFAVKPEGTTTYTRENIHQFKYAIMYSLGYSVDKNLPTDITATFNEYIRDPDIREAARLMSQKNPDMVEVAKIVRKLRRDREEYKDTIRKTDISMISGLTALGKYYDSHDQISKTEGAIEELKAENPADLQEQIDALNKANDFIFESDVPFEIDGVSNGFAHTVMQIPVFENEHVLEKHLNQVAVQIGSSPETARHMQDGIYNEKSAVSIALGGEVATDPYIDLQGAVSRAMGIDAARTYLETMTSKNEEVIEAFLANYVDKNEAMANAAPMVRNVTRNLVKYPFMIFMYGGGIASIARGVASEVIDDLYKTAGELRKNFVTTNTALTEANKSGDAKAIADAKSAHAESVAAIEDLRSNLVLLEGSNSTALAAALSKTSGLDPNVAFNNFTFEEATLKSEIGALLEPRFGTGLNAMLGDTDAIRKAVIQSGELLHAIFMQRYNIARKEYILKNRPKEFKEDKKTGKSIAQQEQEYADRTWLSDKEIEEIVLHKDMVEWLPQFNGPIMEDGELVDLTKRKSDKTTKAIGKIVIQLRSYEDGSAQYKERSVSTNTRQKDFVAPGVSALIRTVINFDAAALAVALEQVPTVLMLYDAAFGRPEDLRKFAAAYNEAFKQLHLNNSIVEQMNKRVIEAQQRAEQYNIDNPDAADIMDGAKTWITEEAFVNRNTKDPASFDELAAGLQTAADLTAERRKDLKAKEDQIHVQQMAIGDLSGENSAAGIPVDDRVNQVNTGKELHRIVVLFEDMKNSSIARLPQKVVDILEPLARSASAEYVVNMLSSFQPEHTGRYMDMMFAYEDAKDVSGGITDYALDLGRLHGDLPADAKRADLLKAGKKVIVAVVTKSDLTYETDMGAGPAKLLAERTELLFNKYLKTDMNFIKPDSPFDAQIAEIMAEYNTPTKKELGTLENQRRTNPHTVLNTSIDATNVTKLFNKFKDMSRKYYNSQEKMDTHGVALERILESITKGLDHIDGISLEVEQVNGITQGRYFDAQKRVRVSLSRELPGGRNEYSPQEVYLHEMLHALTVTALEGNESLREEIHTVRKSVKAAIDAQGGYKVFLSGIPAGNRPTKREIDFAKKQYNYVFGAEARNVPEEFLAYALTNPSMIEAMQAHSRTTPDRGTTILGQLHSVLDKVVAFFIRAITRKNNPTSYEEMVAIAEQLMDIQVKHESVADKAISKIIGSSDRADRKVAAFVAKKAMDLYDSDVTTGFRKYTNAAIGLGVTQVTKNAAVQHASSEVYSRMHSIVGSTIKEMGDQGALTPALIKQLLHSLGKIGKLYQQFELDTVRRMSQQWKSIKDEEVGFKTRQAITRVMYRTDLSSLLDNGRVVYSPQQILSMIRNPASAETAKKLLIKQIGIGAKSDAIRYAEDLGYFIATNRGKLPQGHFNAHTIAQKYLTEEQRTPDNIHRLDAIATLASLEHQNSLDLKLVGDLMAKEFEANPNENMFTYLLQSHRAYTKKSFKDLFHSNPTQMVKGYTSERVDNLTDMRTGLGDAKTERKMAREGYTRPYTLGKINGVPQAHTTMYISRYMPEIRHVSGIMSTTGLHHKGTLISEIIAKDGKFQNADGTVNLKAVHDYIKDLHKREERDAKNGVTHKDHNLRPLYDDAGNITDYRVIMNYESQEELFSPEMEFQDVFAHMESAYISKRNTVIADIQTVDLLVDEWVRIEPTGQHKFINIMDPNGKYHDRYKKLPEEVRNYMNQFTVNGEFLVREDIIDKVFGYPAMDMSNISVIQAEMLGPIRSILRNVHYGLRKFMTFGMERIVMATLKVILNNVVSNALQLTIFQKIPPAYTARKMKEGYAAFERYEADQQNFRDTSHFLAQATPNSVEHTRLTSELEALREQIEENPIHKLSELGVNSMLLEDVNTASREGFMSRAHQMLQTDKLQKTASFVPTKVTGLAKNMLLTRDSEIYKYHRQAVQLTDFLGRYVMISHAVEVKGMDFDTVLHEAIDAFVLFDENMHPAFEAINSMGFTAFLSYWLRITRPVRRYITRSPVTVGTAAGVQAITDVDTLAMMNGSIFGGKFLPNMWYMDDLADAATNIYGVENAITIGRVVEKLIPGD